MRRVIAILLLLVIPAAIAHAADPGLTTRVFTARHRPVDEIVALIQPAITDQGSYAVQPRARAVTVTDTAEALARIEGLIASFDTPPKGIGLVMQLMRAEEGAPSETPATRTARRAGLPPAVIQDVTRWGVVTPIGSASIQTTEGGSGLVLLGDEHRARFTAGALSATAGIVRLERFVLERLRPVPEPSGKAAPRWTPLMDLVLNLKDRQTTVLGATSSQDAKQALFVSITATAVADAEEP